MHRQWNKLQIFKGMLQIFIYIFFPGFPADFTYCCTVVHLYCLQWTLLEFDGTYVFVRFFFFVLRIVAKSVKKDLCASDYIWYSRLWMSY